MNILVTGGAGYIGSHTVKMLLEKGFNVTVFDNLSRGHIESIPKGIPFEIVNLLDFENLKSSFRKYKFDAIIHFAAFAYVGESTENPEMYFKNNVLGSNNLIKLAKENGVKHFVFSSTCSLYGNPLKTPISEKEIVKPINPYAKTKMIVEEILDFYDISYGMKHIALRYFNAAGASDDSSIGESHDPEPHLIPLVLYSALGKRENIRIYGDDYNTKDGTCIRDYIHVNDLADAHIRALELLIRNNQSDVINLGTGVGYSVKEIISKSRKITGREIKSEIIQRRQGDPDSLVADNQKAKNILGWVPEYDLDRIIETAWKWHQNQKY
ncbi:MAG TPA: UDP-glucose 4-epimerase GalE [Ignavibacteria bacterium]